MFQVRVQEDLRAGGKSRAKKSSLGVIISNTTSQPLFDYSAMRVQIDSGVTRCELCFGTRRRLVELALISR